MSDIVALLHCLTPYVSNTTMRQMQQIVYAVAVYPGSGDDVEQRTLGGTRGQLSNDSALVPYAVGLGDNVVVDCPNIFA
jgi:hypothetical protein